jgi:AcrR family transcriptional regulator
VSAVKRRYHAPVRQEQAAQTRRRIAAAAAAEFAEHGWSGTTVAAIATRAQVTPQAVHLAVGGKAALLVRAVEVTVAGATDDEPLADRPAFADVYAADIPARRRQEALAAATSDIYGRAARLFLVLQDAAASDAAAAELAAQASARRLADHRRLAGLLAPDAAPAQLDLLTDTIWVLAGPAVYVDLVHRRHWSSAQYATWLTDQLQYAAQLARRPGERDRSDVSA